MKCLVIADDFTGANDTGMQIARRGYQTNVFFQMPEVTEAEASVIIDTESRGLSTSEAYEKVRDMIQKITPGQYTHIIKKVDSTIRGNIAAEIKAVDEWMQSELVIFMPALPALGRTTVDGVHRLNGVRISETELGRDPGSPVVQDHIVELLQERYEECVYHISIEKIKNHAFDFSQGRIYAVDAETDQQMQEVAASALRTGKRVLFAGTAALMDVILEAERPLIPALGLIGSISEVTRRQIHYAKEHGCNILQLHIAELIRQKQGFKEMAEITAGEERFVLPETCGEQMVELLESYVDQAVELLETGKDLLVVSDASWERAAYDATVDAVIKMGLTTAQAGAYTQSILGEAGRKILEKKHASGIFLAGGDTAMGLFRELGADGSEIIGEIAMGIPLMKIKGGKHDGLKVVTKAGAFGNPDAITYGLRKLREG